MMQEVTVEKKHELNSVNAFKEKMYQLGYEDAKNKRSFGESLKGQEDTYEVQGMKVEQLTLF